ncbi:MAG: DUF4105 domain-containing protein [Ferruginibacter sp.]
MKKSTGNFIKRLAFIFSLLHYCVLSFAQDSSHIRISLLTCTPGEELYSTFGHSALRVTDSSSAQDIVFNYGTFNFDDPGFYMKFIRGKLLYFVSTSYFSDFREEYQSTNRGITEQLLNLSAAEKIVIRNFLYNNAKEENKYYKYDFFFDNCTTRLRDIILKHKQNAPKLAAVIPAGTTFRQAIYEYLDKNGKAWSKLGIDILLGAPTDVVMTTSQSEFLPDNLLKAFDSTNQNRQLVLSETNLYPVNADNNSAPLFTPLVVFSLLLLLVFFISLGKSRFAAGFLQGFDGMLFCLTGLLGIALIFMWTATDHAMCRNNYNLLWALPTNTILAFFVNSKKNWVKKAFGITALIMILVLLSWFFLPQQMNKGLIPIVLLLLYRSGIKYAG